MLHRPGSLCVWLLALAVWGAFFPGLLAQNDEAIIKFKEGSDGLKSDWVDAPNGGPAGTSSTPVDSKRWLKIDAQFTVDSPVDVIPEAKFKVYLEVPDIKRPKDSTNNKFIILTGEATYVNLPAVTPGRELHVTFYVHPFTVNRYGGERNFHFSQDQNVHIDAYIGEQKAASKDAFDVPAGDKNWYLSETEKKTPGLVLTKEQSPWSGADAGSYPQAKLKAASGE